MARGTAKTEKGERRRSISKAHQQATPLVCVVTFCSDTMVRFDWDEKKRVENLKRHGIDFADVHQVFDYDRFLIADDRYDYGEQRWISFGMLFGEVVAVAHTETDEVIRIISVRRAERHEQERYFRQIRD